MVPTSANRSAVTLEDGVQAIRYRLWAAVRGLVYLGILAASVSLIPVTTPLGVVAAVALIVVLGFLAFRWLYAAVSGRFSSRMIRTLDAPDQGMP